VARIERRVSSANERATRPFGDAKCHPHVLPPFLHASPQLLADDPQFRLHGHLPPFTRNGPRHITVRPRDALIRRLAPDDEPAIALIAQDPPHTIGCPVSKPFRAWRALRIQAPDDSGNADSVSVPVEHLANDARLVPVNFEPHPQPLRVPVWIPATRWIRDRDRPISIGVSSGRVPPLYLSGEPTADLLSQLLEVQAIYEAVHRDQGFGLLVLGIDALADIDDPATEEPEPLEEAHGVGKVAGDAGAVVNE
jgi:hypothetical protein